MESSLTPRGMPSARISTNASMGSLDIELLIDTPLVHSLMSESITICSLPSISSGDLPAFGPCKLPTWRMIGLGDRLKMFSSSEVGPFSKDGKTSNGKIAISVPTSPRLRTMLKECLSISKWAESSTAWQPPGHIPWESMDDDTATPWVPEGSVLPPEYFSTALSRSRHSHRGIQSRPNGHLSTSNFTRSVTTTTPPTRFTNQDSIDAELLSMMQELKSIRTFFQSSESLDAIAQQAVVPSLVISNSDSIFPMSLDSSSSIMRLRSNSLASRRGKQAPPALLLRKGRSTTDLSYPGIPTAFLGSPSRYIPKFEDVNKEEKPSLEFEDMINNLRLQCSSMALQTPPIDPSLNSRSSPKFKPPHQEADCDEWSFANELIKGHKRPNQQIPRLKTLRTHRRANSHGTRIAKTESPTAEVPKTKIVGNAKEKRAALPKSAGAANGIVTSDESLKTKISTTEIPSKACSPEPLRSAIVKPDPSRALKTSKSVRFFLPRHDLLKEEPAPISDDKKIAPRLDPPSLEVAPSATTPTPTGLITQPKTKESIVESPSEPVLRRKGSKIARALVSAPLSRIRETDRSAATLATSSLRQPSIPSSASEDPKGSLTKSPSRMSVHSLGRHSLSRMMKGPLFSSKDKRATVSSIPFASVNDENAARREGESVLSISKKSRMPVPLRNIFTRFK